MVAQFALFQGQGSAFSLSPTIGFFPALFGVPFVRLATVYMNI